MNETTPNTPSSSKFLQLMLLGFILLSTFPLLLCHVLLMFLFLYWFSLFQTQIITTITTTTKMCPQILQVPCIIAFPLFILSILPKHLVFNTYHL